MRKFLLTAIGAALLLIVLSADYPASSGFSIGDTVPGFSVSNDSNEVEMQQLRGEYVLLSFLTSTNPQSRIANKTYNDFVAGQEGGIEYVAVNFDPSSNVFNEIVKIDGLDACKQFHVERNSALMESYSLRGGCVSLLIAPQGEVVAQNPTLDEVKNVMGV